MDKEKAEPPDCYKCKHRRKLSYDSHSECKNLGAKVMGKPSRHQARLVLLATQLRSRMASRVHRVRGEGGSIAFTLPCA